MEGLCNYHVLIDGLTCIQLGYYTIVMKWISYKTCYTCKILPGFLGQVYSNRIKTWVLLQPSVSYWMDYEILRLAREFIGETFHWAEIPLESSSRVETPPPEYGIWYYFQKGNNQSHIRWTAQTWAQCHILSIQNVTIYNTPPLEIHNVYQNAESLQTMQTMQFIMHSAKVDHVRFAQYESAKQNWE